MVPPRLIPSLIKACGLKGIGQLFTYYEDVEEGSDLRGPANFGAGDTLTTDRTRCQLVLGGYDDPLTMAPTPLALVVAFRDALKVSIVLLCGVHILHLY